MNAKKTNYLLVLVTLFSEPIGSANAQGEQNSTTSFWNRFSNIYNPGKNFLEGLSRGEGRVSEQQGAYVYQYQIELPKGRRGMAPKISLLYSSQGKRSEISLGWKLNIPFIQRSTNFGVPEYTINDPVEFHDEKGQVHHLVPTERDHGISFYRALNVSEYKWFKYNASSDSWSVMYKTGRVQYFGERGHEDAKDPSYHPWPAETFAWHINKEKDSVGNTIIYNYLKDVQNSGARPIIESIEYTGHEYRSEQKWQPYARVDFLWTRSGKSRIHECLKGKCRYLDYYQLDEISTSVRDQDTNYRLVKKYSIFYYDNGPNRFLKSITAAGFNSRGTETKLPPVKFDYAVNDVPISWNSEPDQVCFPDEHEQLPHYFVKYTNEDSKGTSRTLIDMNGDGILDYVDGGTKHYYFIIYFSERNGDKYHFRKPVIWKRPDGDPKHYAGIQFFDINRTPDHIESMNDLLDMNGDGLPDYIYRVFSDEYNGIRVALNNGSGFNEPSDWYVPTVEFGKFDSICMVGAKCIWNAWVKLVELTGDGLPDILSCSPKSSHCKLYKNLGDSFDQTPTPWSVLGSTWSVDSVASYKTKAVTHSTTVDVNGDGLADQLCYNKNLAKHNVIVHFNDGKGFTHDHSVMRPQYIDNVFAGNKGDSFGTRYFIDLDLDGLVDYLNGDLFTWNRNNGSFLLWDKELLVPSDYKHELGTFGRNKGPLGVNKVIDYNGDGVIDLVSALKTSEKFPKRDKRQCINILFGQYRPKNVLTKVHNGYGGRIEIDYMPANKAKNTNLPITIQIVKQVNKIDEVNGTTHVVDYSYSGGMLQVNTGKIAKITKTEYRGFGRVDKSDETRNRLDYTYYHQEDYLAGMEMASYTKALDKKKYFASKINTNICRQVANSSSEGYPEVKFCYKERIKQTIYGTISPIMTSTKYEYDQFGNIEKVFDFGAIKGANHDLDNRETHFDYVWIDNNHNDQYLVVNSKIETYSADKNGQLQKDGKIVNFYDGNDENEDNQNISQGLVTKVRKYKSNEVYYEKESKYDSSCPEITGRSCGIPLWDTDFEKNKTDYIFDGTTQSHITHMFRGELVNRYEYDIGLNVAEKECDPNNVCIKKIHDGFGRLKNVSWQEEDSQGNSIGRAWPIRSLVYRDGYSTGKTPPSHTEYITVEQDPFVLMVKSAWYNGFGNKIHTTETHNSQDAKYIIQNIEYDNAGRVKRVTTPHFGPHVGQPCNSPSFENCSSLFHYNAHTKYEYDQLDRPIVVTKRRTKKELSKGLPFLTTRSFEYFGTQKVTLTDEEGKKLSTLQDARGNIVAVIKYNSNGKEIISNYTYDSSDKIVSASDPLGNTIVYKRDWLGKIEEIILPGDNQSWLVENNGNGDIESTLSPEGRYVDNEYNDPLGRITRRTVSKGNILEDEVVFQYDEETSYGKGRLTSAESKSGIATYLFNPLGKITNRGWTSNWSGNYYETKQEFNNAGYMKAITYPNSVSYEYKYNNDGTPRELYKSDIPTPLVSNVSYDESRHLIEYKFLGHKFLREYDSFGQILKIQSSKISPSILYLDRTIGYYNNGRIKTVVDAGKVPEDITFQYDALWRLESAQGSRFDFTYVYDDANRIQDVISSERSASNENKFEDPRFPWAPTEMVDRMDNARTLSSTSYDKDGFVSNLINSDGVFSYDVNGLGLVSRERKNVMEETYWFYDHNGVRVHEERHLDRKSIGWTDFVGKFFEHDETKRTFFKNVTINEVVERQHLFFGRIRIGTVVDSSSFNSTLYYVNHTDEKNSVRFVTEELNDSVVAQKHYYPFGSEFDSFDKTGANIGYNDKRVEGKSGLLRFPARMYSPRAATWAALDPLALKNPQVLLTDGVNPYAFCTNDPVNMIDPTGLAGQFMTLAEYQMKGESANAEDFPIVGSAMTAYQTGEALADGNYKKAGINAGVFIAGVLLGNLGGKIFKKIFKKSGDEIVDASKTLAPKAGKTPAPNLCFPAGTYISTPEGLLPIENIETGQLVLAYDFALGEVVEKTVTDTLQRWTKSLVEIEVAGEVLRSTLSHPYWTVERGWVQADRLQEGDVLLLVDGRTSIVKSIQVLEETVAVFNFEVDDAHNYFVGESGVLVHNPEPDPKSDEFFKNSGAAVKRALAWLRSRGVDTENLVPTQTKWGYGMFTPNRKSGFRIEFDTRSKAHINVVHGKVKGPHLRFPGNEKSVKTLWRTLFCR